MNTIRVRHKSGAKELIYASSFDPAKHTIVSGGAVPPMPDKVRDITLQHSVSPTRLSDDLDALKARADELGLSYGTRVGAQTLRSRIEAAERG